MNPKRDLMAALAASLFLAGVTGQARQAAPNGTPNGAAASQDDDSWKTSPTVQTNAESIRLWLKDVPRTQAKTVNQLRQQFKALDVRAVDDALRYLLYAEDAKREGDGTKASPYAYWGQCLEGCG